MYIDILMFCARGFLIFLILNIASLYMVSAAKRGHRCDISGSEITPTHCYPDTSGVDSSTDMRHSVRQLYVSGSPTLAVSEG